MGWTCGCFQVLWSSARRASCSGLIWNWRQTRWPNGFEDGVVGFFGQVGFFAGADGIEFGEGEFGAGGDAGVDFIQAIEFGVEKLEWFAGDFEGEAFGARFGNALDDVIVCFGAEPFGDLADFFFGEGGEGALFSHKRKS